MFSIYYPRWKAPKNIEQTVYNIRETYKEVLKRNKPVAFVAAHNNEYVFRIGDDETDGIKYFILSPQRKRK